MRYRHHEPGSDTYHALCGPLEIRRPTRRQVGVRNGPIVVAMELAAELVEGATPALAYSVVHGYAQHDMRAHKEGLEAAHREPPSRTTLERIATRLGSAAVGGAAKIEPVVRRAERVPEATAAISIGLDRTSVAMMEDRPADAAPKPERKRLRPRQRRAPAPFDVHWRMGYVGTERVYQEMKGELGLDHFEGRSFPGWHHHVSVALCCYAFVIGERMRHFPPTTGRRSPARADALAA